MKFGETGILHRSGETAQPRWRRDGVYKLILGTGGTLSFETPRSRLDVRNGQFLLLSPEEKHRQVRCDGDKFLFEFSPGAVNEATREVMGASASDVRFRHTPLFHRELARLARSLIPELHDVRPGRGLLLEHAALQLLVLAVRGVQSSASDSARGVDAPGVQRAIRMMMECHRDPLPLDSIAAHAGMDKFALIRQFRESVGTTPYEWLQQYRLRRVGEELLETRRKVLDIALDHGFSSVSALNRRFRRLYGSSPTQWRRLRQRRVGKDGEDDAHPAEGEQDRDADPT